MKCITPTYYFENIYNIDEQFLKSEGISALILDVDNTLISNTVDDADEKLKQWINNMTAKGIKLCIVSNGKGHRVKRFNKPFDIPVVFEALKPRRRGFREALKILDTTKANTVVVGDQLYTDILGGYRAELRTILIKPIDEHEQSFIKFKRMLEKPFINSLKKKGVIK